MAKKKERKANPERVERSKLNKFRRIVRAALKTNNEKDQIKVLKKVLEHAGFNKTTMTTGMEKYLKLKKISPSDIY